MSATKGVVRENPDWRAQLQTLYAPSQSQRVAMSVPCRQ